MYKYVQVNKKQKRMNTNEIRPNYQWECRQWRSHDHQQTQSLISSRISNSHWKRMTSGCFFAANLPEEAQYVWGLHYFCRGVCLSGSFSVIYCIAFYPCYLLWTMLIEQVFSNTAGTLRLAHLHLCAGERLCACLKPPLHLSRLRIIKLHQPGMLA